MVFASFFEINIKYNGELTWVILFGKLTKLKLIRWIWTQFQQSYGLGFQCKINRLIVRLNTRNVSIPKHILWCLSNAIHSTQAYHRIGASFNQIKSTYSWMMREFELLPLLLPPLYNITMTKNYNHRNVCRAYVASSIQCTASSEIIGFLIVCRLVDSIQYAAMWHLCVVCTTDTEYIGPQKWVKRLNKQKMQWFNSPSLSSTRRHASTSSKRGRIRLFIYVYM